MEDQHTAHKKEDESKCRLHNLAGIFFAFLCVYFLLTAGVAEKHGSLLIPVTIGAGGESAAGILN